MPMNTIKRFEMIAIGYYSRRVPRRRPCGGKRNVLNFFYDSAYYTPPVLPEIESYKKGNDEDVNIRQREEITERTKELPSIKLYPNPVKNAITIEYSGLSENDKLIVCNVLGTLYETKTLGTNNGKVVLNTSNYQNGIYLLRVEMDGKTLLKNRFIVLK